MADVQLRMNFSVLFSNNEYSLVTKALTGKLKQEGPELEEAQALGLKLLQAKVDRIQDSIEMASGAVDRTEERLGLKPAS